MTKKLFWLYDVMRESMQLFRAGFHIEEGCWALNDMLFASREGAIDYMRELAVKRAIEKTSRP